MTTYDWTSDPYWQNGSDLLEEIREGDGHIRIDLKELEKTIYDGGGPAYKLMDAMLSVKQNESDSGFRGAPRVLLALLAQLDNLRK